MNLYLIENKINSWGDWGEILWAGFAPWDDNSNLVYIERTGPFTPSIYIADGNLIISNEVKLKLEHSSLKGISFSYKLEKKKIVNIDWSNWDKNENISSYVDDIHEPEDIIYNNPHDSWTMKNMPDLWLGEIDNRIHLILDRSKKTSNPSDYIYIENGYKNESNIDFFMGIERIGYFITPKAKEWMEKNCPNCFDFFPIEQK